MFLLITSIEDLNHPPLQQQSSNRLLFSNELQFLPGDGTELNLDLYYRIQSKLQYNILNYMVYK